jgi:hypothetical protein
VAAVLDAPPMPAPKFATVRDESRPTLGHRQARFAAGMLGQPFMPHQRLIADVAGELVETDDPRGWKLDGRAGYWVPRYKLVVVTEPRQAGKSHQSMAGTGERCFTVPGFRSWYTAQTGQDARDQFLKFEEENIRGRPLDRFVTLKRGKGEEVLTFPNGSRIRPHPPTEEKLHGKQSHRNDVDEAWAFEEVQGRALMQAIGPTQLTVPTAQTWVWSAGGTANSTWLAGLVARGREGDPSLAFFEWAIPDNADAEDMSVILEHHPAAGRTISAESLRALHDTSFPDDPAGWARAAGNRWTEAIGGAISLDVWRQRRHPDAIPSAAPVAYGAARSADGSQTAIVAAAQVDDRVVVEVIAVLPGAYGAADRIKALCTDGPVGIAPDGPSAGLHKAVERLPRVRLTSYKVRDYSAACANLVDALEAGAYRFRQHPALDAAVAVAAKRSLGDGGWVWSRVSNDAHIAVLEAATIAADLVANRPLSKGVPRIITAA